jgi:hypothetical protein
MKKTMMLCLLAGALFSASSFAATTEYWNDFGVSYKGIENTQLNFQFGQRDRAGRGLYFYDFKPAAKYSFNSLIDGLLGYRFERTKSGTTWGNQNRFEGGFGLKADFAGFAFYSSHQVEHILPPNSAASSTNYKHKVTASYPVELMGQAFKLSIADELFFNFNGTIFNKNRIIGGVSTNIMKELAFNLGYMNEGSKTTSWAYSNIFMTAFTYSL